jgi:prepilin peptidase CpaA
LEYFLIILLSSAISISVIEDVRRGKIPNAITFPTLVVALVYHFLTAGLPGLLFSTGGLAVGMGLFIIPYIMRGMGAGDVKLIGATGAILGAKGIVIASIIAVLSGGVYGLILLALNPGYGASALARIWMTIKTFFLTRQFILIPPDKDKPRPVLKYAIPIAIGTLGYMFMLITGYDLFPELLGDQFEILSIALSKGGT